MSSVDAKEIEKFNNHAQEWWSEDGYFSPLHKFNSARLEFMKETFAKHFNRDLSVEKPFDGLTLLDVGCGGGLLAEPLAKLGFNVIGIDAGSKAIEQAKEHARGQNIEIEYLVSTAEELNKDNVFDVVLNMEILEHVQNIKSFVKASCSHLNNNGLYIASSLNRTVKSYLEAKIAAEYILRWVPAGTHDWNKFVKPSELAEYLSYCNCGVTKVKGISFNIFNQSWNLSNDCEVNYICYAIKQEK